MLSNSYRSEKPGICSGHSSLDVRYLSIRETSNNLSRPSITPTVLHKASTGPIKLCSAGGEKKFMIRQTRWGRWLCQCEWKNP
jgi:hypothetical protein